MESRAIHSGRKTIEIGGSRHTAPIPSGCRVGPLICSSALLGGEPATGAVPEDGAEQTKLVFANLRSFLAEAGTGPECLAKVDVLLAPGESREALNAEWERMFPDQDDRPARHVTVQPLPRNFKIQLEVIGYAL